MKRSMMRARSLPRKMFGAGVFQAVVAAGVLAAAGLVRAGSYTNSASGNWDADASWTGGKPSPGGASDAAIVFSPTGVDNSVNNLTGSFVLNRMEFASGTVTVSGNAFTFSNNGATGPTVANASGNAAVIKNNVALAGETTFSAAHDITVSGTLSGSGALVKAGAGNLTLATNRTYTGSTTVSAGTLTINTVTNAASMSSTNVLIRSGATMKILVGLNVNAFSPPNTAVFNLMANATLTSDVPTIHCGNLTAATGATVDGSYGCLSLHATDTFSQVVATLGSLTFKRLILEPNSAVNPTQTLRFDGTGGGLVIGTTSGNPFSWRPGSSSGLYTFNMDIADSPSADVDLLVPFLNLRPGSGGIAFVKKGAGVMQLNSLEWLTAPTPIKPTGCTVSEGKFVINTSATNSLGVNFASLSVAGGATLQVGDGGTTGAIYANVANDGNVTFSRSDAVTYAKAISGAGSVTKVGTNTLTLTGVNTYSGGTAVSGGLLLVNAPGSLGAGSAATVSGGTLGGSGTVSCPVTVSADGRLAPGGLNTVGSLTLADGGAGALTLNGGELLADVSNVAGTCDVIVVSGNLVLNGASTVALSFPNGSVPAGTYTLMTYAAKTGDGTLALDARYPNATLTVGDTSVTLTVGGTGITYLKWNGNVSGTWDTTTANWLRDGLPAVYTDGDGVIFDDSATGNYTVSAPADVSPASLTFNNSITGSARDYAIAANIAGDGTTLRLRGSGTVALSGTNSYTGGTLLHGGTLIVSAYANLPAAGGVTFDGGSLRVLGSAIPSLNPYAVNWATFNGGLNIGEATHTFTVTNAIGGSGSLYKTGAGALALTAANTYSGGTTVNGGIVKIRASEALGSGAVSLAVGSEVDLMGGLTVTNPVAVRGVGASSSGEGSLRSVGGTSNTWAGPVTLGENQARIGALGGVLEVAGVIDSGTNKYDLVVRNPNDVGGTVLLSANNSWQGNTWIRCGTIKLGVSDALPVTTVLQQGLNAGQTGVTNATFDLAGFSQRIAGLTDVGTDNLHVVTNSAPAVATLTVSNASSYAYSGALAGNLNVVKTGAGTLTLAGANGCGGSLVVSNGTLAVGSAGSLGLSCTNIVVAGGTLALSNSACLADAACVSIADGGVAKVSLAAGVNETVGTLFFGDKRKAGGTYGGTGSGADVIDPVHFAGTGILSVLHGGGTLITVR